MFALEIPQIDDTWDLLKDFSSLATANRYIRNKLSNRKCRIIDRNTGQIVRYVEENVSEELSSEIFSDLRQELERFDNTDRWRQRFREEEQQRRNNVFVGAPGPARPVILNGWSFGDSDKIDWAKEGF